MTEKQKKAIVALCELVNAAGCSSSFEDLYEFKDRSIDEAVKEILEAISD